MSTDTTLTDADEGKTVVDSSGDTIGRVVEVSGDTAHVEPDPGITDSIMSKLGWGDSDEDTYALRADSVEEVTDDQIRLGSM